MCCCGCFYERTDGSCRGRKALSTVKPDCMDEEDWSAAQDDWDGPADWESDY